MTPLDPHPGLFGSPAKEAALRRAGRLPCRWNHGAALDDRQFRLATLVGDYSSRSSIARFIESNSSREISPSR